MPFQNEHAARLKSPGQYKKIRRKNNEFGDGIHAIFGIKIVDGERKAELQAIRFDKEKFTVAQAKKWLADHDYKPISFEPAGEKETLGYSFERSTVLDEAYQEIKEVTAEELWDEWKELADAGLSVEPIPPGMKMTLEKKDGDLKQTEGKGEYPAKEILDALDRIGGAFIIEGYAADEIFTITDLLNLEGEDNTVFSYKERRRRMNELDMSKIAPKGNIIVCPASFVETEQEFFDAFWAWRGYEGSPGIKIRELMAPLKAYHQESRHSELLSGIEYGEVETFKLWRIWGKMPNESAHKSEENLRRESASYPCHYEFRFMRVDHLECVLIDTPHLSQRRDNLMLNMVGECKLLENKPLVWNDIDEMNGRVIQDSDKSGKMFFVDEGDYMLLSRTDIREATGQSRACELRLTFRNHTELSGDWAIKLDKNGVGTIQKQ